MKIKDLWKEKNKPTLSCEFYPARDEEGAIKLQAVIDKVAAQNPDYVSVTFGAGGSTREGSYHLAANLKERGLAVMPYLAAYGMGPGEVKAVLDDYRDLGIDALLCARGDKPAEGGVKPHPEGFPHAPELLAHVKERYDFFLAAAGYPEGHKDAADKAGDFAYVKAKVEAGASVIITQFFYDNRFFFDFRDKCREAGITVPIVAGIMPIYSVKMMEMLCELGGTSITPRVREGLAQLPPGDKKAVAAFGIEFVLGQCRELIAQGVDGLHIYTMDKSKAAVTVIETLRTEGLI